jgi:hypothetical protein
VKDNLIVTPRVAQSANDMTSRDWAGISPRRHHDHHGMIGPQTEGGLGICSATPVQVPRQPPLSTSEHSLGEVTLKERHQHLAFRITKAAIELENFWTVGSDHQPRVKHTNEWDSSLSQFMNCRAHDLPHAG